MTKDQVLGIMAATIYAARTSANPNRHRLDTLRKEAVREADELFDEVLERDSEGKLRQ